VINRSPSVAAVVGNFTFSDVGLIVAPTLFAAAFGFWSGARAPRARRARSRGRLLAHGAAPRMRAVCARACTQVSRFADHR